MVATVKVRNFHATKAVLESFGVDPACVLKSVGLDGNLFSNRETVVLYADLVRFAAAAAHATQCEDFGLLTGMRQDATAVGLAGVMSVNAVRVGEALDILASGLRITDTGGVFSYESRKGSLYLSYVVSGSFGDGVYHVIDGAIAIICNILRQLSGAEWRPDRVALTGPAPRELGRCRQFFRAPVEFGAAEAVMVCDAGVLNRQIATHNQHHIEILAPLFDAAVGQAGGDFLSVVRSVLKAQVSGGRLTRTRAAQAMGLTEHVLVHRLAEAKANFSVLAEEVKYELARRELAAGKALRAVAGELGFADAAAFSRAFVKWSGETPGRWRAERGRRPASAD